FQGAIDEVRVYNRALTQAQVQTDINAPLGYSIVPPTNLVATVISATQIFLTWEAAQSNQGIANYRVERCAGSGCAAFALVATTSATTYSDPSVTTNTTYRY